MYIYTHYYVYIYIPPCLDVINQSRDHPCSPHRPEVNEADRMILWAEMDADNTGQVTKDEFEDAACWGAGKCWGKPEKPWFFHGENHGTYGKIGESHGEDW